ncbi:MAG: 2-oxoacid:acceptor oxidoreductase subunit alpha [Deltaproteobacteria bacterium]|nr:2-oxoacid:acceptor oxidoreductase subunit alpha [Deltaproteobacteria bacterium]MBW2047481.1 2-oxoacid:acceptor oxidoreductase subunit alpha [Deltaproteobacteria bacterium]MBW2110812.1 2-oxoacid:acceptor oxidoreductase subunit alpha [Deltaproteobacteria bacterium]MBW2352197.1 2-oxoacid:acceptor oxidoreductase subunit alpha [Deltaproteobacteria bacterium]
MNTPLSEKRRLVQGNEAIAEGALAAGCRFFAGYPITPASEISEVLSSRLPQVGGSFIQMEDEIASMGAIIGASIAGVKAMTATSGPGFSLMQENLGFACITETPCVVVNVMRGGGSTGLPTCPGQGDVMQAKWGTHGDHPIIVLAVSSVADCFEITIQAFNLSEKYRVPVVILSDEVVSHTRETVVFPSPWDMEIVDRTGPSVPPEWYVPYEDNSIGVPDMATLGEGYRYHITGLIHDERGFPTQRPEEIEAFTGRLFRKLAQGLHEIQKIKTFMMNDAEVAVIAYGSVSRAARSAVLEARDRGVRAGMLQLITLFPFPEHLVDNVLKQCSKVVVPEMNMGQIYREVQRVNQGKTRVEKYSRIDGQFITPDEILGKLLPEE